MDNDADKAKGKTPIEITTIGGFNEVGKNMTAIKVGDTAVIMDMGLHIENFVRFKGEEDNFAALTVAEMQKADAVPNDRCIDDWKRNVRAIVPTHAHLDHVGAIPFMANRYDAPVICTPFTSEVLKAILYDEKLKIKNEIKPMNPNSMQRISDEVKLEFIHMTHSTPQTVMAALHTKEGAIIYANDFKFDNSPTLGAKPNYKRLQELGDQGVKLLIVDGTRATRSGRTPSESIARELLRDVLFREDANEGLLIVTTFSSHLARLKSVVEFGKKMNRKIVFLGRSLAKYVQAGEAAGIADFSHDVEIVKYSKQIQKRLRQLNNENRNRYMLVVTGHQGEPGSVLSKIINRDIVFDLHPEDQIIFSCSVIPNPSNIANRQLMEDQLKKLKVRVFKDIHTSGHASKEDLRDLISMVKPEHIIPAHGDFTMISALTDLTLEMGYRVGQTVHIMKDGQRMKL